MKLVKFGQNFFICFEKEMVELGQNGQNLLKYTLGYGILAKNRPLVTEIGLKKGPLRAAQ